MRNILVLLLLFLCFLVEAQTKMVSWNVRDFGASKSEETVAFIADALIDYDIVAIQEVVAGYGGAQAVAKLADELNRRGTKWDYTISDPTNSSAYRTERYAFLWRTAKVKKIGKAWLEQKFKIEIDREPFMCTFEIEGKRLTVANFHAITKKMQPETEIKYFKYLPETYPKLNLVFVGDFNCPQSHTVFNPLKKMGYYPVFQNQKTSLRQECFNNDCLASEYDNIYYHNSKIQLIESKALLFFEELESLIEARKVSDHIPISMEFEIN
ncbi:endonuclease/exonuclease/phosphatase family protein [Flavobacteriaceae bacterium KMM 6897]|nr:endonuclease/exonuclease/phosphatase family protein [Flavobacteriaceae bacterium KMM 6897]